MKLVIEGFNQEEALKYKKDIDGKEIKIDCIDLVILRWFVDFYPNMNKMNIEGKEYAWLSYKKLEEDLPLLNINKRAFSERLKKLVNFDILSYKLCKDNGNFTFFGFGNNYEKLIKTSNDTLCSQNDTLCSQNDTLCSQNDTLCSQNDTLCRSNDIPYVVETTNKNNILNNIEKDNNKLLSTKKFQKPTIEDIKNYCYERNNGINAEYFYDFYEARNWMVGKNKMKDWKACIRTWERNNNTKQQEPTKPTSYGPKKDEYGGFSL